MSDKEHSLSSHTADYEVEKSADNSSVIQYWPEEHRFAGTSSNSSDTPLPVLHNTSSEEQRIFQKLQTNPEILDKLPNRGFLERPLIRISPEQTSFIVRAGGPNGRYGYHLFHSLDEARSYAAWVASQGTHWITETTALPRRWPGANRDNPVISSLTIYEIPPNTIYLQGVIASQPESPPHSAHLYPGGGPQIEFPKQSSGLIAIEEMPIHTDGRPKSPQSGSLPPSHLTSVETTKSSPLPESKGPTTRSSSVRATGELSSEGKVILGAQHSQETVFNGTETDSTPLYSTTRATSGSLTYQQDEHGHNVGAEVSHRRSEQLGDTNFSKSVSAGGYIHISDEGKVDGGGGNISIGSDRTTVTVGGGVRITARSPVLEDGNYVVIWENSATSSLGAGYKRGFAGGSASFSRSGGISGQRIFASREEAQAFYDSKAWARISLDDASQFSEGETATKTSGGQFNPGGTINLNGVSVGASISIGKGQSVEVTGLTQHQISVRITDYSILGGSLTLGAPGIGMSGGLQQTTTTGQIANFDLNTVEGRIAFDYLCEVGRLPNSGFTLVGNLSGKSDTESTGLNLGIASLTGTNTTAEIAVFDSEGRPLAEQRTGTQSTNLRVPGAGNFSKSHLMASSENVKTGERSYSTTITVSSSSTKDVNRALAESTGYHYSDKASRQLENQSSRQWEVISTFTESQIRLLMQAMIKGHFNYYLLIYQAGHGKEFMDAVKRAGTNMDEVDRAISEFISETGSRGLLLICQTIGVRPIFNLRLTGDKYMTGEQGHTKLAERMATFETRLASSGNIRALGIEISKEYSAQQARLTAIMNPELYPDLPHELRQKEVERSKAEIIRLSGLLDRALAVVRGTSPKATDTSGLSKAIPTAHASAWAEIGTEESNVQTSRQRTVKEGNEARRHHWIQVIGAYSIRSAIDTYGQEGGWILSEGEHYIEYVVAQSYLDNANRAWEQAETAWTNYSRQKIELEFGTGVSAEAIQSLCLALENCLQLYDSARRQFHSASIIYNDILHLHIEEGRNNQFNAYTQGMRLPAELQLI